MTMTIQTLQKSRPSVRLALVRLTFDRLTFDRLTFDRLAARLRRAALVAALMGALVGASASAAMAAPLTLSYPVDLFPSPVAKFDTTLGTLLGVEITISTVLSAVNPFAPQGQNSDTCSAAFTGASITISAPGTPTLLTLDGTGNASGPCDRYEFGVLKQSAATVDPSFFGAFTSVGISPITLNVIPVSGTAAFTRGAETRTTDAYWHPGLTSGLLTYTYCPVGEQCLTTPPPPPTPSVPEPTTAVLLSLGLTGLLARRRSPR